MVRALWVTVAVMTVAGAPLVAQNRPASPRDSVRATVGAAKVLIDYGRPSKRGRIIFDSLVPYGAVWRTGANQATTLVTDKPLMVGTLSVPAGTYTIYTVPNKTSWSLIINKQTGQWGTEYNAPQDLGRVEMSVASLPTPVEMFTIKIADNKLSMSWDTTVASVAISSK